MNEEERKAAQYARVKRWRASERGQAWKAKYLAERKEERRRAKAARLAVLRKAGLMP